MTNVVPTNPRTVISISPIPLGTKPLPHSPILGLAKNKLAANARSINPTNPIINFSKARYRFLKQNKKAMAAALNTTTMYSNFT